MGEQRGGAGLIVVAFVISVIASVAFMIGYQTNGGTQWLGLSMATAFGALGTGLALWSRRLMPQGPAEEPRPVLVPPEEEEREAAQTFQEGRQAIQRRGLLGGLLASALAALGLGALWPAQSLGPAPRTSVRTTGWREGVHLVDERGRRVGVNALDFGSVLTVFPEGRDPTADDQVILLRIPSENLALPADRSEWTPEGYIAYSKVCTHAGCPVGLYQDVGLLLLCPCHQATFDVAQGARPVYGPAPRGLPQLPLQLLGGQLVAAGDFSGPVGPDRWRVGEAKQ